MTALTHDFKVKISKIARCQTADTKLILQQTYSSNLSAFKCVYSKRNQVVCLRIMLAPKIGLPDQTFPISGKLASLNYYFYWSNNLKSTNLINIWSGYIYSCSKQLCESPFSNSTEKKIFKTQFNIRKWMSLFVALVFHFFLNTIKIKFIDLCCRLVGLLFAIFSPLP